MPKLNPLDAKLNGAALIPTFDPLAPRLNPLDAKLKGAVIPTFGPLVLILNPFEAKLIEPISKIEFVLHIVFT